VLQSGVFETAALFQSVVHLVQTCYTEMLIRTRSMHDRVKILYFSVIGKPEVK
jgi:hypothetical protein